MVEYTNKYKRKFIYTSIMYMKQFICMVPYVVPECGRR